MEKGYGFAMVTCIEYVFIDHLTSETSTNLIEECTGQFAQVNNINIMMGDKLVNTEAKSLD